MYPHLDICAFCSKEMQHSSLSLHVASCPNIQALEPRRKCEHCNILLGESGCFFHEAFCDKNGTDFVKRRCGNCKVFVVKQNKRYQYRYHLSKCLTFLKEYTTKLLESCTNSDILVLANMTNQTTISSSKRSLRNTSKKSDSNHSDDKSRYYTALTPGDSQCYYCLKVQQTSALINHTVNCKNIQALQPNRVCAHCNLVLPEGNSIVHQAQCSKNPLSFSQVLNCPVCENYTTTDCTELRKHVNLKCNTFLASCFARSREHTRILEQLKSAKGREKEVLLKKLPQFDTTINQGWFDQKKGWNFKKCPLCISTSVSNMETFKSHIVLCSFVTQSEPIRRCQKTQSCPYVYSLGKSYLHEAGCQGKAQRTKVLTCPICSKYETSNKANFRYHLATECLVDRYGKYWKVYENEEFQNEPLSPKEPKQFQCFFCLKECHFVGIDHHLMTCSMIKKFEPKRKCNNCYAFDA